MKKVEAEFERNLSSEVELIPIVGRYVLSGGGKRIRPLLLILSSRMAGYTGERMVPLAAIMEFIHTATLLHDDVVDNADIRRGRDSAKKVWGNEASVLVGDFLFSKSFSLMTNHGDMRILRAVSDATTQMAEGEVLQLVNTCDVDLLEDEYLEVVVSKTAVLLAVACEVGGLLGGLAEEEVTELRAFGMELGIAFQLIDDCLDYVADQSEFGKALGSDLEEGKITMPLIHVLSKCDGDERQRMVEIVEDEELSDESLDFVLGLIDKYDGIEAARQKAIERVEAAKKRLESFEDCLEKQALMKLADYVVERRL
jgi:octaprenyl-diphosphate synthase